MFAIIVEFKGATNSSPSRMTVKSMFQTKAKTVHYPALNTLGKDFDYASPRDCSEYAAQVHLDELNKNEVTPYKLDGYFQGADNDQRIWTVKRF